MSEPQTSAGLRHTPPRRVCILGLGQMGLVAAGLLSTREDPAGPSPEIIMWGHSEDESGPLMQTRTSPRLPGFTLPPSVRIAMSDAEALENVDLIVCAIPVQFIRSVWTRLRAYVPARASVVSVSKGIENKTLLRPTQIIADVLQDDPDAAPRPIGVLSGPTIAAELALGLPATMVASCEIAGFASALQNLFSTSFLRIYTNEDTLGVELAGATKNVIAIAAGIIDGLQAGANAKSALLARGLAEITRLGSTMGASSETFFGIAGVGDLATTCFSPEGRNRSLGEALGRGTSLDEYLASSQFVVEGVATTRSVMDLAERYRVDMPITQAVHAVLFEQLDPIDAISMLMSRELKSERLG
ncbi:MAG: NAD(P)-dependent glycerol-3-phosphate dehydrogenase [Planctomycetota bacterium]|nr:MAG: NAD(P)-dependent glycerol-3-phosphate dehydrogenase [Planctomycetota bacterium]